MKELIRRAFGIFVLISIIAIITFAIIEMVRGG